MIKYFLIFLYIFFQMDVSGQDTVIWNLLKVDENLSVRLPGHVERVDTTINKNGKDFQSLIYRAQTADYNFGVTVTMMNSETGDYNAEQASEANRGLEYGMRKSAESKGLEIKFIDTTIDGVSGRKVIMYRKDDYARSVTTYVFLSNGNVYQVAASRKDNNTGGYDSDRAEFFNSIHFVGKKVNKKSASSEYEEDAGLAKKVGWSVLMFAALILFVRYVVRKK